LVRGAGYKSLMAQPSQGSAERGRAQKFTSSTPQRRRTKSASYIPQHIDKYLVDFFGSLVDLVTEPTNLNE